MALDFKRLATKAQIWARRVGLSRKLALMLVAAVVPSVIITFLVITVAGPLGPDPRVVMSLITLDLTLLLALGALVSLRIWRIWRGRNTGATGSRLQLKFISLFGLLAVTPAIVVAVGSTLFFKYGVESWFSDRVRTALHASLEVAKAYKEEHQQAIAGAAFAMSSDIERQGTGWMYAPQGFAAFLSSQANLRNLTEVVVFEYPNRVIAKSNLAFSIVASLDQLPPWAIEKARAGEVVVINNEDDDRVRAIVRLQSLFGDVYLYVGRPVDPRVIGHMEQTSAAVAEYDRLEGTRVTLEQAFSLIFAIISLLLLLGAVWVGLTLAMRLARPIEQLIDAAEEVRAGNWNTSVPETAADEIGKLSRAFNRMTIQLGQQRQSLIEANRELDERNRFTETVLEGVSAGVVGLDPMGMINLPNRAACEILGREPEDLVDHKLSDLVPELRETLIEAQRRPDRISQSEVRLTNSGISRTLLVKVAAEQLAGETIGFVVTFDDITELMGAQRKAAWADVARRIAHEIKNPLTPIQLSAERLKRKYLKEIESDPETFQRLVETIVRQVGDIGRMVDEFSSFARMPSAQLKRNDLSDVCRQAVFLQRNGYPDVSFETELQGPAVINCDAHLVGQALTNLLKNAVEAIRGREGQDLSPGQIKLSLTTEGKAWTVAVTDNGKGLPETDRDRLTEPYVTTRSKGTGLGLAIVKKIMEDHRGNLTLEDAPGGGARVSLLFPMTDDPASEASEQRAIHGA